MELRLPARLYISREVKIIIYKLIYSKFLDLMMIFSSIINLEDKNR